MIEVHTVKNTVPEVAAQSDGFAVSCYENEVPPFVEREMERLYENLFSSLVQFRIYGAIAGASTYVVRDNACGGKVTSLLLFRRNKGTVRVINEVIKLDEKEISRFVDYIFTTFGSVGVILFHAIQTDVCRLPFPYQRFNCLEDIVLSLPATTDEYLASLGKATRKTIKGYMNKLRRAFPSFSYQIYGKDELTEQQIREIVKLNVARMSEKNKVSAYEEAEIIRLVALAKKCGVVGIGTIDGRICAGAVSFRVGDNFFMSINAYDPAYDDYRLGTLCGFLIISECIAQGGKECHLLWGRSEYKYRFLGVQRDLDNVAVYRSRLHQLRHADIALMTAFKGYTRRAKLWFQDAQQEDRIAWRVVNLLVIVARSMKRLGEITLPVHK